MNRIHHYVFNHGQKLPRTLALAVSLAFSLPAQAASGDTGGSGGACLSKTDIHNYIGQCGGSATNPAANGNVTIQDDHPLDSSSGVDNIIAGGYTEDSIAMNNRLTISGGNIGALVYGGYLAGTIGAATDNTLEITGGTLTKEGYGGYSAAGVAARNAVNMTGGQAYWLYGGWSDNGNALNNTVTVTGGRVTGRVYGGVSDVSDGLASGNTVLITGGTIDSYVIGGMARLGNATGNTISISGGTIKGDIMVGSTISGAATGNRLILSGAPDIASSNLIGGRVDPASRDLSTGNVLEVRTTGLTAKSVDYFQEYHFILPANVMAGATALTLTSGATDLRGAKVGVALAAGGNVLQTGDRITLIRNDNGLTTDPTIQRANLSGTQGVSLRYTFDVSADSNHLYATAAEGAAGAAATVMDQTKAPVEGRASTMALASQGSDLAGGAGMARAVAATEGVSGTATFGATSGGSSRYHSGSYVDADGIALMIGAAKRYPAATGDWMAGVFLEGGYGSYDTYNDFAGQPTVRGHGKSHYVGGGMLLRRDWAGFGQAGPYAEGSLRVGRVSSDWRSGDMIGGNASYDTAALYYGAHIGTGYVLALNDKTSLDGYVKGFWTHQNSDSVSIAGDPYEFKAMDSFRSRLGLRLNRNLTEQITAYAGAAWEHEFDGKARATTYGLDTPSPSLKGDTGVFEIGFDMKPKANGPLTVGLGMQAYTGMREGFGGTAKLMWVF